MIRKFEDIVAERGPSRPVRRLKRKYRKRAVRVAESIVEPQEPEPVAEPATPCLDVVRAPSIRIFPLMVRPCRHRLGTFQ